MYLNFKTTQCFSGKFMIKSLYDLSKYRYSYQYKLESINGVPINKKLHTSAISFYWICLLI